MKAAKRVAMNTGFLYARMAITVFISLYSTRLILAALGTEDFGIFNVVGGAIAMLTFLNIAMTTATQRFMSYAQGEGDETKQKYIFNVSILLHFIIAIFVILLLEVGAYFLFNGILDLPEERIGAAKIVYQIMLMSTFFTIISVPYDAIINAHENMLFVAILGIFEALLKLSIAIYITYTAYDKLIMYGILMVLLPILILFVRGIYCHKKYTETVINPKKYTDRNLFKEMMGFASWSLISSAASIISMQGVSILLNSFFGVIVNAAQGVTNQVSGQLMAFSNTMLKALNPVIVKSEGEKNRKQMLRASIIGNKISFFLMAVLSIPVVIDMPFIFNFWLKDVPEYAIIFCRLSLLRAALNQLTVTFPTAIGATGKIRQSSFWNSFIYILLLPVSYFTFVCDLPPYMIYINLIFMALGLAISHIYFVKKECELDIKDFIKNVVIRCILAATITLILSSTPLLFMRESVLRLLLIVLINGISFITLAYLIGLHGDEKRIIEEGAKTLFKKIKK